MGKLQYYSEGFSDLLLIKFQIDIDPSLVQCTTATISHYTAQHWMWSVLYHNNVNSPRRRTPRSGGEGQRKAPPTWWGPPTSAPARVESHSLRLDPLEVDLQAQLKGESFTGTNINIKKAGKWAEPIRSKRLNPTIIRIEYLNFWIFKLVSCSRTRTTM